MSKRFGVLKGNDNPFRQENAKKKKLNKSSNDKPNGAMFKTNNRNERKPLRDRRVSKPDLEVKANIFTEKITLTEDAFPELVKSDNDVNINKTSSKLSFGKAVKNRTPLSCKPSQSDKSHIIHQGVNLYSTEKTKLSLKITNLIIKKMEEQERKAHYLYWLNNWRIDRAERMENGETFYEPYSLDDLDYDDDSEQEDDEMEETEYWNLGRGKQGRSCDN